MPTVSTTRPSWSCRSSFRVPSAAVTSVKALLRPVVMFAAVRSARRAFGICSSTLVRLWHDLGRLGAIIQADMDCRQCDDRKSGERELASGLRKVCRTGQAQGLVVLQGAFQGMRTWFRSLTADTPCMRPS